MKKSKLKFLAIDPMSTYATYDGKVANTYSVNKKKPFFSFYSNLVDILKIGKGGCGYNALVMEYTHFPYISSQKIMNFQRGVLKMFCEFLNIPLIEYAPTTIKKSFTGDGKSKKDKMIKECKRRGIEVKNDHEADAVALHYHHLGVLKNGK